MKKNLYSASFGNPVYDISWQLKCFPTSILTFFKMFRNAAGQVRALNS